MGSSSSESKKPLRDLSSLGNPHQVRVTHLDWKVQVDFEDTIFRATAAYTLERVDAAATVLQLDTAHLVIQSINDPATGEALSYRWNPGQKPHLGTQLEIDLPNTNNNSKGATSKISISYETTQAASAIQWLLPSQTSGKKHPYLFTQCQAIHARSMVPCQDQPGVKMTYEAQVTVPSWAVCVMSAVQQSETSQGESKVYVWKQNVPISSYLLAMAVGDLKKKDISDRCAVWSEPALVEAVAYEFAETESFLKIAEQLAGTPYVWGRYDLLCLPPSFPYGGMENPCLTTVTPTLLARDRSLADVVAHEIAHSWTGNLVTNATWDHFWLNEGWTTWYQRKIMARIHRNDKFFDFDALGGYKTLQDTINSEMPEEFQSLVLPIGDGDPDESYSSVAYEKGFLLLTSLERRVGTPAFEDFFQAYIKNFKSKTLTTEDFKAFFLDHFKGVDAIKDVDWDAWLYTPGMPPEEVRFDRSLAESSEKLANAWLAFDREGGPEPTTEIKDWSSNQITCFLDFLQLLTEEKPLKVDTLKSIDAKYDFAQSQNSEILFRFCQLSIASEDQSMLLVILHFITSQGRMKFVRPLYRALYASKMASSIAVEAFLQNQDFYHPICTKMIASDLMIPYNDEPEFEPIIGLKQALKWAAIVGAVAGTIGFVLSRRKT